MSKRASQFERVPRGFYPTPWAAFEPLVAHLPPFDASVIEPCAGDGALCVHLSIAARPPVWGADVEPRHPRVVKLDARNIDCADVADLPSPVFVTNPPWPEPRRNGEPTLSIAEHLIYLAPTWLLLPSDFMHNVYAAPLMGLCRKIVSVGRVKWIPDSEHDGGFDNCAWYFFDTAYTDHGIEFVPRQAKRRAVA